MKIAIIGTGNLAYHLAKAISSSGHKVCQICGRDAGTTSRMASEFVAQPIFLPDAPDADADFYFLCVSDNAIAETSSRITAGHGVVVHCAGSVDIAELKCRHANCAVMYPLQTFSRPRDLIFSAVPLLVEGSDDHSLRKIKEFAEVLSGEVRVMNSRLRLQLHLSAVFASNFTNYMATIAFEYASTNGIEPKLLLPLLGETFHKLLNTSPREAQTGPARRNDVNVIEKHLELLNSQPDFRGIYLAVSRSICELYNKDKCLITRKN